MEWVGYGLYSHGYSTDCEVLVLLLQTVSERMGEKCVLVDVGANVGMCSLVAVVRGHRVVAVEADAENVRALEANKALNAPWATAPEALTIIHAAAGAHGAGANARVLEVRKNRALSIVLPADQPDAEKAALNSKSFWRPIQEDTVSYSTVPTVTVDDALQKVWPGIWLDDAKGSSPGCIVLKSDTEGAEIDVLKGATQLLSAPNLLQGFLVERYPQLLEIRGHSGAQLDAALKLPDFHVHHFEAEGDGIGGYMGMRGEPPPVLPHVS